MALLYQITSTGYLAIMASAVEDRHAIQACLGNEHAIERVTVMERKPRAVYDVAELNREK
jgi:hypothetical protein